MNVMCLVAEEVASLQGSSDHMRSVQ
jgi:hypothetical protein